MTDSAPRLVKKVKVPPVEEWAPADVFPYWMVWRNGKQRWRPKRRHASELSAHIEAQRLAELVPGQRFLIVRIEAQIVVQEPRTTTTSGLTSTSEPVESP